MEAKTIKDAKLLVPNSEHKNFTTTGEIIPKGTLLEGEHKSIKGLRRGKPFTYRVFITNNGEIIFSNNLEAMNTTEVTLGADASQTPTVVNMRPAETFKKSRLIAGVAGAGAGFYFAKKKGYSKKKKVAFTVGGALLGYLAVWAFDKTKDVTVTPSK